MGAAVVLAVVAACSGGDDDDAEQLATKASGPRARRSRRDAVDDRRAWIDDYAALDDEGRESLELVGTRAIAAARPTSATARSSTTCPCVPRSSSSTSTTTARSLGASDSLTDTRPDPGIEQQLDEAEATDVANKAVPVPVEETTAANVVWLPDGDRLRLGWSVQMATERQLLHGLGRRRDRRGRRRQGDAPRAGGRRL